MIGRENTDEILGRSGFDDDTVESGLGQNLTMEDDAHLEELKYAQALDNLLAVDEDNSKVSSGGSNDHPCDHSGSEDTAKETVSTETNVSSDFLRFFSRAHGINNPAHDLATTTAGDTVDRAVV